MRSESQVLFDPSLLNSLPIKAVPMNMAPVSNKEAQALFDIWSSNKDQNGNPIIPDGMNENLLVGLARRGIIDLTYGVEGRTFRPVQTVRFGSVADKVIKNIILSGETSRFEKKEATIDYELIHRAAIAGALGKKADTKTASYDRTTAKTVSNWLTRLNNASDINCDN